MSNKKHCTYCNKDITSSNFSEHKKTTKHKLNVKNYQTPNLLDFGENTDKGDIIYIKIKLEEIKKEIDTILDNIK